MRRFCCAAILLCLCLANSFGQKLDTTKLTKTPVVANNPYKQALSRYIAGMTGVGCDTVLIKQLLQALKEPATAKNMVTIPSGTKSRIAIPAELQSGLSTTTSANTTSTSSTNGWNQPNNYLNLPDSYQWYVSPNGSDNNPGTQQAPFQTIQKAVDMASNGDAIKIADGNYSYFAIYGKNIYIIGNVACPQLVVIDGNDSSGAHLYSCSPELHGMTFINGTFGISMENAYPFLSHLILTQNWEVIYAYGQYFAYTMCNSLIYGNNSSSLAILHEPTTHGFVDICNATIANNRAQHTIGRTWSTGQCDIYLLNTILYNPETYGELLIPYGSYSSCTVAYCNVYGKSNLPTDMIAFGDGVIDMFPEFAEENPNARYQLANNSPCIDAGFPDFYDYSSPPGKGGSRSDMGAYGYESRMTGICHIPTPGDVMSSPIDVGAYNTAFQYADGKNTANEFTDTYGLPTNDVFYRFIINKKMNITVSHCSSSVSDTYLYLLDAAGNRIAENDNYSGAGRCPNTRHAYLRKSGLAPGAYYVVSEGVSGNGYIYTNIAGTLPVTSAEFGYPDAPDAGSSESAPVGSIAGSFDVSATGAATYTIPIEVPPGVGGMQPSVAIVYNSQAGNGIAGWGCSIAGVSAVMRAPKDMYHDYTASGITHGLIDAFVLDGQRLIYDDYDDIQHTHEGEVDAVYHPENDPLTKVTIQGSYAANNDIRWFKVERGGMTYQYGSNVNALQEFSVNGYYKTNAWFLNRVEDALGNYMEYSYTTTGEIGSKFLSSITYGKNTNTSTSLQNTISFGYTSGRQDPVIQLMGGKAVKTTYRLSTITSKTGNNTYRTYALTYNTNGDGSAIQYSRLTQVTVKNGAGEALKPVTLNWNYLPARTITNNTPTGFPTSSDTGDKYYLSADLNGDGISDLVEIDVNKYDTRSAAIVYQSGCANGVVSFTPSAEILLPQEFKVTSGGLWQSTSGTLIIQNQGRQYVFKPSWQAAGSNRSFYLTIFDNTGLSSALANERTLALANDSEEPPYTTGDVNNDGMDDFIYLAKEKTNNLYRGKIGLLKDFSSAGNKFTWLDFAVTLTARPEKVFLADFNGNGMNDLMVFYSGGYTLFRNTGNSAQPFSDSNSETRTDVADMKMIRMGDFNGDGLPDFIMNDSNDRNWHIALNNGNGTFNSQVAYTFTEDIYDQTTANDNNYFSCQVFDFDLDGKSDVVITKGLFKWHSGFPSGSWKHDHTRTFWMRSNGATLDTPIANTSSGEEYNAKSGFFVTGDFKGNGQVCLANYGYNCYNGTASPAWRVYGNPSFTTSSGKVTGIQNVAGTTAITYKYMTDPDVYTKLQGGVGSNTYHPVADVTPPMPAVKTVTLPNGVAGNITVNYHYEGMKVHTKGLGFIGMKKVTATNTTTGVKTETGIDSWFTLYTYHLGLKKTYSKTIIGEKAETVETEMDYISGEQSKTWHNVMSEQTISGMDGETTVTTYRYDRTFQSPTKGRILGDSTTYGDGMYRATRYNDYVSTASGYKPRLITATQKYPDDGAFVQKTRMEYNVKGLPVSKIENYGSSKPLTTEFSYDAFGNLNSAKVSASDVKSITTHTEYDASKRFPIRQYTTPASTIAVFEYDTWGNVTKEKDETNPADILVTNHGYDNWGRRTTSTLPDGRKTGYSTGWGNTTAKRYYTLTQATGAPWVKTWYDATGRETGAETRGPDEMVIAVEKTYNSKGELTRQETMTGALNAWETFTYDARGRVTEYKNNREQHITSEYAPRKVTTTEHNPAGNKITAKTVNAWGGITKSEDAAGGTVEYKYFSSGKPRQVEAAGAIFKMEYDAMGNQTKLDDPNAGITTYTYDAAGRLRTQKDGRDTLTTIHYDRMGRDSCTIQGSIRTVYTYGTSNNELHRLIKVQTGVNSTEYTYDRYGHLKTEKRTLPGESTMDFGYTYDKGRLQTTTYPGGVQVTNEYDAYGNLVKVLAGTQAVWELTGATGLQTTTRLGSSMTATSTYNPQGHLTGLKTAKGATTIRNMDFVFNGATGNLASRKGMFAEQETFHYDHLERLDTIKLGSPGVLQMGLAYAANGNITAKTGLGEYTYHSNKKHAVETIENTGNLLNTRGQKIGYNAFNKASYLIDTLNNDAYRLDITYGPGQQRWKTVLKKNNNPTKTVIFAGNYEKISDNGVTRELYYISGGDGLAAIYVKAGSSYNMYYAHTDHLGSIISLTDDNGNSVFKATYDAWGKQTVTTNTVGFHRGYTGHEHLSEFSLINMNGRMYDPVVGRFLSPDPYVQAPDFSQNFNRYSYCLNNPLIYTDPSGELFLLGWTIVGIATYYGAKQGKEIAQSKGYDSGDWQTYAYMTGYAHLRAGQTYLALAGTPNVPGMMTNGLLQSGMQVGLNGISNVGNGDNFFDNWGRAAAIGFVSGAYSGYKISKAGGLNYWWGTPEEKWGHNRNQWSLAWWDKPDKIIFEEVNNTGQGRINCMAKSFQNMYGDTEEYWDTYTNSGDDMHTMQTIRNGGGSVMQYSGDNPQVTYDNILNLNQNGGRSMITVENYRNSGEDHAMAVKKILYVPGKRFDAVIYDSYQGNRYKMKNFNRGTSLGRNLRFWFINM